IKYLLNEISKFKIPDIYYCNKSFKIYENVILHYKENNVEKFNNIIADLIVKTIIKFYQETIIKRIINIIYFYFNILEIKIILQSIIELYEEIIIIKIINLKFFYFDIYQRKIILQNCAYLIKQQNEKIRETPYLEIKKYILEKRNILLEGVANFRTNEYIK